MKVTDTLLEDQILREAVRIGDDLLSQAKQDENGKYWMAMGQDVRGQITWNSTADLYLGASGIALFFMDLFRMTQSERYLQAAREGMRWAIVNSKAHGAESYGFFAGRMGVCFGLKNLFKLTEELRWIDEAVSIAKECGPFLRSVRTRNELLNGRAGTLLGLLHLYAVTQDSGILELMRFGVEQLLDQAFHGPVGLYWDRSGDQIHGLCGLSHGSGGVGLVFLELGKHFHNESFYWMAEQSFDYESSFFDQERNNWPDLRKEPWQPNDEEIFRREYLQGNLKFFSQSAEMNAWCHGAAGIGLSRLRAYELLGKPEYQKDALLALERSRTSILQRPFDHSSFTLCHGMGGVADLFLEAYRSWNNPEHLGLARELAEWMLQMRNMEGSYRSGHPVSPHQEDTSLFMGNAGIGHFYLRVVDPLRTLSILLPRVEESSESTNSDRGRPLTEISATDVRERILKRAFPRTIEAIQAIVPSVVSHFVQANSRATREGELDRFSEFVEGVIRRLSPPEADRVERVFMFEREKVMMDREIDSNALIRVSEATKIERASKLLKLGLEEFTSLELELDKSCRLVELQLDIASEAQRTTSAAEHEGERDREKTQLVLLRLSPEGIVEIPLSTLSYRILKVFFEKKTVGEATEALLRGSDFEQTDKSDELRLVLISQIKEALRAGILVSGGLPEFESEKQKVQSL